jgi:hypothetical protein
MHSHWEEVAQPLFSVRGLFGSCLRPGLGVSLTKAHSEESLCYTTGNFAASQLTIPPAISLT